MITQLFDVLKKQWIVHFNVWYVTYVSIKCFKIKREKIQSHIAT